MRVGLVVGFLVRVGLVVGLLVRDGLGVRVGLGVDTGRVGGFVRVGGSSLGAHWRSQVLRQLENISSSSQSRSLSSAELT